MTHTMGAAAAGWIAAAVVMWILATSAAVWAVAHLIHRPRRRPIGLPSPLDILERRYAAGKLTREDFHDARARLREHELDL